MRLKARAISVNAESLIRYASSNPLITMRRASETAGFLRKCHAREGNEALSIYETDFRRKMNPSLILCSS